VSLDQCFQGTLRPYGCRGGRRRAGPKSKVRSPKSGLGRGIQGHYRLLKVKNSGPDGMRRWEIRITIMIRTKGGGRHGLIKANQTQSNRRKWMVGELRSFASTRRQERQFQPSVLMVDSGKGPKPLRNDQIQANPTIELTLSPFRRESEQQEGCPLSPRLRRTGPLGGLGRPAGTGKLPVPPARADASGRASRRGQNLVASRGANGKLPPHNEGTYGH
jgi:hypothetical protein